MREIKVGADKKNILGLFGKSFDQISKEQNLTGLQYFSPNEQLKKMVLYSNKAFLLNLRTCKKGNITITHAT